MFVSNQAFGIASASFGADGTQILALQRQINRFLSDDDFGFSSKIDETGVMSSETIAQLPRAARNALAIVGPLGAVVTASLLPAAIGMDDDDILANLDALVAAFSQIAIPTAEDQATAQQAITDVGVGPISTTDQVKVTQAAVQATAQAAAQGQSKPQQQAAAKAAVQQVLATPPKKKFFDAKNPMLWVVVGGSVVALVGIGVLLRRKPTATPMGKRRRR